jgi:hypothetical protein
MHYEPTGYQIVRYTPTHKPEVLELLAPMWKDYDYTGRNEIFNWRYEFNPYEKPIIFLAIDKDHVIGFRSFISQKFIKGDQIFLVFSPADTIIHPDYRRRGIISALNDKVINELNSNYKNQNIILINTSTSKPSMPVYLKQQWQKSNGLRRFYFKFLFSNYFNNNRSVLTDPVRFTQHGYEIEITPKVKSKELSDFNARIRNPIRWTNLRDEEFFNWRYSFQPEKYTYIYCYSEKQLQGYLIIKQLSDRKSSLDQYETINMKIFTLMIKSAVKFLRIAQLRSYAFLPEEKKLLKKSGFIAEPVHLLEKLGHLRFPVLVRPIIPMPEEKDFLIDGKDIRNINNWHLQVADRH